MKIALDLQAAQNDSSFRGVGRYSKSLAKAMACQAVERAHEVWLVLNGNFPDSIMPLSKEFSGFIPANQVAVFPSSGAVTATAPENRGRTRAAEIARERFIAALKPDALHLTSLFEGSVDDAVTSVGRSGVYVPTAVTLYDLIPMALKELYYTGQEFVEYYEGKLQSLRKADYLLAISEYSRKEAIELLGFNEDRIVNISGAVESMFAPQQYGADEAKRLLSKYEITKPFVLYVPGGFDPRKNFANLISAFARLPAAIRGNYQLVIGSNVKPAVRSELGGMARSSGLHESELVLTGYVPDDELVALYNLCEVHVFPSLYEGFGLPALEAMACGAASIGSNTSSIPEVIGDAEALFDPRSVDAIANKICQALQDKQFRLSLKQHAITHAARFSWERSAKLALDQLEQMRGLNSR